MAAVKIKINSKIISSKIKKKTITMGYKFFKNKNKKYSNTRKTSY